jgi:WD40 repeat protein
MIEMDDSMFASGGNDKKIIIWKKEEDNKNYITFQKISKEISNLKNGVTHLLFLYDKRFVSSDSNSFYVWNVENNKILNPNNFYSIQQKITNIKGTLTALYQIKEGAIISGNNNSLFEVWNEVDGKFKSIQNINLKISSITCINQLNDHKIIVASNQGLMKTLVYKDNEYQVNEYITLIKGIPIQSIECFEDGSFVVGQKTSLHVWRNNESI